MYLGIGRKRRGVEAAFQGGAGGRAETRAVLDNRELCRVYSMLVLNTLVVSFNLPKIDLLQYNCYIRRAIRIPLISLDAMRLK